MPDLHVWEDIRLAYETSAETVAEIAARFGVRPRDVSAAANAPGSGWQLRERGAAALAIAHAKRAVQTLEASLAPVATESGCPLPACSAELLEPIAYPPTLKSAISGGTPSHRKAIIKRLYNVLDAKLTEVEARITAQKKLTGPDTEREARQLANLIKTFEKLTELSDAPIKAAKSSIAAAADQTEDDAERLREDLLERFKRLQQQSFDPPPAA